MRIIVIDDEFNTRMGIIRLIGKYCPGCTVIGEAENGAQGLKMIRELQPDLAIVDIRMPEMDGLQMLKAVRECGIQIKTVILSGYSEFEYAQQAIKYGVSDYLLKPITMERLTETVEQIKNELALRAQLDSAGLPTDESIVFSAIVGNPIAETPMKSKLQNQPFGLVLCHAPCAEVKELLEQAMKRLRVAEYFLINLEPYHELVVILPNLTVTEPLEAALQLQVADKAAQADVAGTTLGFICAQGLDELRPRLQTIRNELRWSIVLGDALLISHEKISEVQVIPIRYPAEIENAMKSAICAGDSKRIDSLTKEFLQWWLNRLFRPEQVVDCYVRFATSVLNILKECNLEQYKQIDSKSIFQKLTGSKSRFELESAFREMMLKIRQEQVSDSLIYSLLVRKSLDTIAENYHDGISLGELAERLHVTPEYLGSLFTKEVGIGFSSYLKELRIKKAKELLLQSKLKTYEIALAVGYGDPKYFCRVFKEVTGISPGEFIKLNK